jgi:hypothetical protein
MNSTGSPEQPSDTPPVAAPPASGVPLKVILLGILAVLLAVFIGTQVLGVLYTILFPPAPPLPANTTQISHQNLDYGVDDWEYGTDQSGCDVVTFYMDKGGVCRAAPFACGGQLSLGDNSGDGSAEHVARCVGETHVSLFAMRWEAIIATGYSSGGKTHFRLTREMYWTGAVPPKQQQSP